MVWNICDSCLYKIKPRPPECTSCFIFSPDPAKSDNFKPKKGYVNPGFMPVRDKSYPVECGTCKNVQWCQRNPKDNPCTTYERGPAFTCKNGHPEFYCNALREIRQLYSEPAKDKKGNPVPGTGGVFLGTAWDFYCPTCGVIMVANYKWAPLPKNSPPMPVETHVGARCIEGYKEEEKVALKERGEILAAKPAPKARKPRAVKEKTTPAKIGCEPCDPPAADHYPASGGVNWKGEPFKNPEGAWLCIKSTTEKVKCPYWFDGGVCGGHPTPEKPGSWTCALDLGHVDPGACPKCGINAWVTWTDGSVICKTPGCHTEILDNGMPLKVLKTDVRHELTARKAPMPLPPKPVKPKRPTGLDRWL